MLQEIGEADKGGLDQIRTQLAETQVKVDLQVNLNEAKFSAAVAEAVTRSLKELVDQVRAEVKIQIEAMQRGLMQRNIH